MSIFVFFFKQKTAYELRISDWSSDVCSSDLFDERVTVGGHLAAMVADEDVGEGDDILCLGVEQADRPDVLLQAVFAEIEHRLRRLHPLEQQPCRLVHPDRSEEHTSELQSLMRISYAVFCLKKNKDTTKIPHRNTLLTPNTSR